MPQEAKPKDFILGYRYTSEELSSPSTTNRLLFERLNMDRFGSLKNQESCTVPEKLQLDSVTSSNFFSSASDEGIDPDRPQFESSRTVKEVRFPIHGDMDPISPNPDKDSNSKDPSLPIEEGSVPEKPGPYEENISEKSSPAC